MTKCLKGLRWFSAELWADEMAIQIFFSVSNASKLPIIQGISNLVECRHKKSQLSKLAFLV